MKKLLKNILLTTIILGTTSCGWLNEDLEAQPEASSPSEQADVKETTLKEAVQSLDSVDKNEPIQKNNIPESKEIESGKTTKIDSHYGILIEELGMQIKKLRAELDFLNEEIYDLKAQSQVWENPFSIYNKEIVLDNGTTIYGKIIYQDQDIIKVETLIGGLTIDRTTIVKVTENVVEMLPKDSLSAQPLKNFIKDGAIIEVQQTAGASDIERKNSKPSANLIILGILNSCISVCNDFLIENSVTLLSDGIISQQIIFPITEFGFE